MSILSIASNASAWRGYEYYKEKRVLSWKQTSEHEFEGEVAGSEKEQYHVMIDTEHPKEADRYIAEIEEYEREEEERELKRSDQIVKYVKSLSKEELRIALINALVEAEDRDHYRY